MQQTKTIKIHKYGENGRGVITVVPLPGVTKYEIWIDRLDEIHGQKDPITIFPLQPINASGTTEIINIPLQTLILSRHTEALYKPSVGKYLFTICADVGGKEVKEEFTFDLTAEDVMELFGINPKIEDKKPDQTELPVKGLDGVNGNNHNGHERLSDMPLIKAKKQIKKAVPQLRFVTWCVALIVVWFKKLFSKSNDPAVYLAIIADLQKQIKSFQAEETRILGLLADDKGRIAGLSETLENIRAQQVHMRYDYESLERELDGLREVALKNVFHSTVVENTVKNGGYLKPIGITMIFLLIIYLCSVGWVGDYLARL